MRKITQKAVFLLLMLGGIFCQSQESSDAQTALLKAQEQLKEGSTIYNPQEALATYQELAEKGNVIAMNGLGVIYSKGLGVPMNEKEGIKWFEKAANNGYANAWYNLALFYKDGVGKTKDPFKAVTNFEKAAKAGYTPAWQKWAEMYKDGEGVTQNYQLAMDIFKQGADNGSTRCLYGQGYLYYKGLGCTQDYDKAIELFQLGSQKGDRVAMYMLGLCFRNGYGTIIDSKKAKYWLEKSASNGEKMAQQELAEAKPENAKPNQSKTISKPIDEVITVTETETPKVFKKVKQSPLKNNLSGEYSGYLLCYDWSGQNIISKTALQIDLLQNGKKFSGEWNEEGLTSFFTADVKENAIVFHDSKISRMEYYHKNGATTYELKEAKLQQLQTDESTFLVGNIQLFDNIRRENEKPMYLILEKKEEHTNVSTENEIVSSVVIYPNPIISDFNLSFNLAKAADITMGIYNLNGVRLYNQEWKNLPSGLNNKTLQLNAPEGYYLMRLKYDNVVKTVILIKK